MSMPQRRHLTAVILAAGEGSRMLSDRPKPLHFLCGRPMLMYVLDSVRGADPDRAVIVVGHKADLVTAKISSVETGMPIEFRTQAQQRGTGDAAMAGLVGIEDPDDDGDVIVLPGDAPLLRAETVEALVEHHRTSGAAATVLTAELPDPTGYGRILRGRDSRVARIVEQGDATDEELELTEVNTSVYVFRQSLLVPSLRRLQPDNSQGEYYLTDVVSVLATAGHPVESMVAPDPLETAGVNDRLQLAQAEAELRRRTNERLQRNGVTMLDPAATYVDTTVDVGRDVTLFPGVILQGDTMVGEGTEIGPGSRLVDCSIGSGCILESTTARRATVGDDSVVGPYAVLAEGTKLPDRTITGPFYTSGAES